MTDDGPPERRDVDPAEIEALRRLLETDPEALIEVFARADIEWGLHGSE